MIKSSGDWKLHKITDQVYFYRGFFSNSIVFILIKSVIIVDTQVSPLGARNLIKAIRKISDLPISHVINTHFHGDHTGGNSEFPEAQIIACNETVKFIQERDPERLKYAITFGLEFQDYHQIKLPDTTFNGTMELEVDGEKFNLMQIGKAESSDAIVVFWPRKKLIVTGDGVSTWDYPYLGAPFVDEGLHDDGEWLNFLNFILDLKPDYLLPGHGPALIGTEKITARVELLISLMTDLIINVKNELKKGNSVPEIVSIVGKKLEYYPNRPDLHEQTTSQRFAIYRVINSLLAERKGKGWWSDLRPSVIQRENEQKVLFHFHIIKKQLSPYNYFNKLIKQKKYTLVIPLLELWLKENPEDAKSFAILSDVLFDCSAKVKPTVDATEFLVYSSNTAKKALELDPVSVIANLNLGALEAFGGMVLAQPMEQPIKKLKFAFCSGQLNLKQKIKACFFLGKAYQLEENKKESDYWYSKILPFGLRWFFPFISNRFKNYP